MPLLKKSRPKVGGSDTASMTTTATKTSSTLRKQRPTIQSIYVGSTERCIACLQGIARQGSLFCGISCITGTRDGGTKLLNISATHNGFRVVTDLFTQAWGHNTRIPVVRHIFAIITTENSNQQYKNYRDSVEAKRKFVAKGLSPGNEQPRWHGTKRECNLGNTPSQSSLCFSNECGLCGIIRHSYDISYSGNKWERYGKAIYSTRTSSKANDYSRNSQSSSLKALLLNDVIIGKGSEISRDAPKMVAPPSGYDSVLAVPAKRLSRYGGPRGLNYDETVVYRNDAIRPKYLVIYEHTDP